MKKFEVVESYDKNKLVEEINMMLNEGWELHGPTVVKENKGADTIYSIFYYMQALVRKNTFGSAAIEEEYLP